MIELTIQDNGFKTEKLIKI